MAVQPLTFIKSSSPQPACHTHVCQPVASLSIPPLKSFAHVPYRETFSDNKFCKSKIVIHYNGFTGTSSVHLINTKLFIEKFAHKSGGQLDAFANFLFEKFSFTSLLPKSFLHLAMNATARFCGQKRGFARRKLVSSFALLTSWLCSVGKKNDIFQCRRKSIGKGKGKLVMCKFLLSICRYVFTWNATARFCNEN